MIKKIFLSIVLLGSFSFSQENSVFTSLTGLDDSLGVTHLYYRSGSSIDIYNLVYHFIPGTPIDSAFIDAYVINYPPPTGEIAKAVLDFNFYKGDPEKYLAAGFSILPDNHGYIERFDASAYGGVNNIDHLSFSSQNPDLMYANEGILLKSTNGGITWQDQDRPTFPIISLSPLDDKVMFGFGDNNSLIKSLDSGNTYYTVDTANWDSGSQMYFDPDGVHIYCVSNGYNYNFMKLSTGGGEPFSWVIKKQSDIPIYLSNDSEIPGLIFYANGKNIYKSNDFGNTFNLYKTLERNIVGIYKKPNEDKLYAATKYKIYEITNDSMIVLKSLPIPSDVFDWFPLAIGNKWVYNITLLNYYCWADTQYVKSFEITKDTLISGIRYFKFEPPLDYQYKFVRIDSIDGHLKSLSNFFSYYDTIEISIYDFLMEVGDTVYLNPQEQLPDAYYLASEETNFVLGENRLVRTLYPISFYFPQYSLAYQIGYLDNYSCEFGGSSSYLKGCIINGIVYGDTTVTSVKEDQTVPKEFALYQNYPNPFNPSTAIDYDLPVSSHVTLKIFDILGREVETLVDEFQQAGNHSSKFIISNSGLPSGVYFYQLTVGDFNSVRKLLLLK